MGRRKSKSKRGKQFWRPVGSTSDPPLPPSTAPQPPPSTVPQPPPSTAPRPPPSMAPRPPPSMAPQPPPPPSLAPQPPPSKHQPPSSVEPPSTPPPWIELPADVTANILQRLGAIEILESAQKVCTTWRRVCQDPSMWRVIDMKNYDDICEYITHMCRLAVARSQGQLIDLTLGDGGDDELLNYISEQSSQLKRLKLECCDQITGRGLVEAAKRLPNLEELHLVLMPYAHPTDVEAIGISCPMLKSFSFNARGCRHLIPTSPPEQFIQLVGGLDINGYALAIAKSMPNLCHLQLFANKIRNDGLQAILDGCPHLESLDIRQCFGLDLSGDLGKKCSEQIKYLRRPSDSFSDVPWLVDDFSDSGFSDLYSYGSYDDYGYYDDLDYDDYTNPFSAEYMDDDELWAHGFI